MIPWAFPVEVEQLPFRGAEEGETIKKALLLPLQEPEDLTENRVESGSGSKADGTALEMGSLGPKQGHLAGETSLLFL